MQMYLIDYEYEGRKYCFDFPASSFEDAERRLAAIGKGFEVKGEICNTFACDGGWWTRFKLWWFS